MDTSLVIVESPPKLLSPVMRHDLKRIAQRLIHRDGRLYVQKLHGVASSRIPGTLEQYSITVMYLISRDELRFPKAKQR